MKDHPPAVAVAGHPQESEGEQRSGDTKPGAERERCAQSDAQRPQRRGDRVGERGADEVGQANRFEACRIEVGEIRPSPELEDRLSAL